MAISKSKPVNSHRCLQTESQNRYHRTQHCLFTTTAVPPVCVGVLRSEDGSDFKHSLEAPAGGSHLLVELRRLGKTGGLVEILQREHIGPTFRRTAARLHTLSMNLEIQSS